MSTNRVSEDILKALPTPEATAFHWFGGHKLQGKIAPNGFGVRVTPKGTRTFVYRYRHDGKQWTETVGQWVGSGGTLTVLQAIEKTIDRMKAIEKGQEEAGKVRAYRAPTVQWLKVRAPASADQPAAEKAVTVSDVLDEFVTRHVMRADRPLRSAGDVKRTIERLIKPAIGEIAIREIDRDDITKLLDHVEENSGPVMADRVLAAVRKCFNFYALRDKRFVNPIVKGMARSEALSRDRVLDHQELRDLYAALDVVENVPECYPRYIKFTLLCANRRTESSDMHSSEVNGDDWIIPAARYKRLPKHRNKDHVIQLSPQAKALIGDRTGFIFSSDGGKTAFSGYSKAKRELDKTINDIRAKDGRDPMPNWTLHDLRRTASTLMAEAGVRPDHAERCLGHIISGVAGTYNRFEYPKEKRAAFEALANLIDGITNPQPNVIPLRTNALASV
ncbi:integrase family protein [Bradyrhizobium sp. SZCCHNRI20481]|uniref:tyrosine-type recombinase/integrase n=1 Tax=Bradyrhizobium sp. SZCCHNRI20481 TaxID=3057286 RepID=UPI002916AEDE|nr:integrase family protein [Bradyrhizobium sp. SZCCHNRI20481]